LLKTLVRVISFTDRVFASWFVISWSCTEMVNNLLIVVLSVACIMDIPHMITFSISSFVTMMCRNMVWPCHAFNLKKPKLWDGGFCMMGWEKRDQMMCYKCFTYIWINIHTYTRNNNRYFSDCQIAKMMHQRFEGIKLVGEWLIGKKN
jgi:hypothetical protein